MPTRPTTLSVAAAIELLEGLAVFGMGIYVAVEAVVGQPSDRPSAFALAAAGLIVGVGMGAVGRGLWQVRRWGRSPAVLTQIFAVIIAISMFQSHRYAVGVALVAVGVVAGAALFSGPTTHALVDE